MLLQLANQELKSPACIEARHKYFLRTIKGLNSADIGSIGEGWFQRLYRVDGNQTQVFVSQSEMAKQGITLTQDRKVDEIYGDTIREQKTVSGVLVDSQNSDAARQFNDNVTLVEQGARMTAKNGQVYQVRNLVYVFPVPEGVRANANWMRVQLRDRPYLSFEIFNTRGECKIVSLNNIQ